MNPSLLSDSPLSPALQQLQRVGGEEFVTLVVTTFLGSAPQYAGAALRAVASRDVTAVASACHALRSGAMQIGADELAAACLAVERGAKAGDSVLALAAPVRRVAIELDAAVARLRGRSAPSARAEAPDVRPPPTPVIRSASDAAKDLRASTPRTRVLVVEDDPTTREVLLATLSAFDEGSHLLPGLDVESVGTLGAARALIETGSADVVLLDLGLPDSDGLATFDAVRQIVALPIVILTSLDDQQLALQAVRSGAQDYLLKHHLDGALLRRTVLYAADRFRLQQGATRQLAEQKDEAVARLAAGIAHDVNNLLAVVCGAMEGARSQLPAAHAAHSELDAADQGLRTVATLMRELLAVGRRRASRASAVDVATFLQDLQPGLRHAVGATARLHAHHAPGVGSVHIDATNLEQILLNLVVNARDAIVEQRPPVVGRIAVSAERATVDGGDVVDISVDDNGAGILPEVRDRMFEPFYTTRAARGGTGLGLATVQGIVAQAGGAVHVESTPGRGTRVTIRLPRVSVVASAVPRTRNAAPQRDEPAKPRGATTESSAGSSAGNGAAVLLVDDDPAVRRAVQMMLRRSGFAVHEAPDGMTALDTWRRLRNEITTVLSDLRMPGPVSGSELASRIRAEGGTVRIVLMSGCLDGQVSDLGRAFAVDGFLEKPFRHDDLIAAMRDAGAAA